MMNNMHYTLSRTPNPDTVWDLVGEVHVIEEPNTLKWAEWFEIADRKVALTKMSKKISVSTVFLGLDHGFGEEGRAPILFETMVFGGEHSDYQIRCSTHEDAINMHQNTCKMMGYDHITGEKL